MTPFTLYNSHIGLNQPCFIIAEAGSNHNGDLDMAKSLIHAAHDAGADAVKFQTFKASRLYPKSAGKSDYLGSELSIYDIIKAMEMPESWLEELSQLTHDLGMAFISSPFHEEAVDLLAPYVDAFKVASYELTHEPLLRAIARYNKPVIMSTGASRLIEAKESVDLLRSLGVNRLVVLQCTASYPAPPESAQVGALVHLRESLGVLTGLSDHTSDPAVAPAVAAALGAVVIEKHYTLSKRLPGPDHPFAVTPEGLSALVKGVRQAEEARGVGLKFVHPVEGELRDFARRSLFTTQAIAKGTPFSSENIDVLRQGKLGQGLAPSALPLTYQAVAARDLEEDQPLQAEDLSGIDPTHLPKTGEWDPLSWRSIQMEDLGLVWVWAQDPHTRAASLDSRPISYTTHRSWFLNRLQKLEAHPQGLCQTWIAFRSGNPVGFIRLDPLDSPQGNPTGPSNVKGAMVSIHVAPASRGQGVAQGSLNLLKEWATHHPELTFLDAEVQSFNHPSQKLFTNAGYHPLSSSRPSSTEHDVLRFRLVL